MESVGEHGLRTACSTVNELRKSMSLDNSQYCSQTASDSSNASQYQLTLTTLTPLTVSNPDLSKASSVTTLAATQSLSSRASPNLPPSGAVWPDASMTFDEPPPVFPLRRSVSEGAIWHQKAFASPRSKRSKAKKLRKGALSTEGSPIMRRKASGLRRHRRDTYYSAPVTPRSSRPVSRSNSPTSFSGDERLAIISDVATGLTVPTGSLPKRARGHGSSHHHMLTTDTLLKAARMVSLNQQLRAVEKARAEDLPTCLVVVKGNGHCLQATHMLDRKVRSNVDGIMAHIHSTNLLDELVLLPERLASDDELMLVHPEEYVQLYGNPQAQADQTTCFGLAWDSFISTNWEASAYAARQACAAVIDTCAHVLRGEAKSGVVIAQPGGRLVHPTQACGFGYFNNVAIAAKAAVASGAAAKVLIVDLGATPSGALQAMFANTQAVMVASMHTNTNAEVKGQYGEGDAQGYNINMAWPNDVPVGDSEYIGAFRTLLLPIANEYQPDLILLTGCFDSACPVSPIAYAHLTQMLLAVNSKIVFVLETTSNHADVGVGVEGAICALQGRDLPSLPAMEVRPRLEAVRRLEKTIAALRNHWPSLDTTVNFRFLSPLEHVEEDRKRQDEELEATVALASLSMVAVPEMPTEEALEDARSMDSMEE